MCENWSAVFYRLRLRLSHFYGEVQPATYCCLVHVLAGFVWARAGAALHGCNLTLRLYPVLTPFLVMCSLPLPPGRCPRGLKKRAPHFFSPPENWHPSISHRNSRDVGMLCRVASSSSQISPTGGCTAWRPNCAHGTSWAQRTTRPLLPETWMTA